MEDFMSFLGQSFDDVFEPKSVPGGEYQLRILKAEVRKQKPEKGTAEFIQLRAEIVGEPKAKEITHVIMMPTAEDDIKAKNDKMSRQLVFLKACGLDPASVNNINEVEGCTFWAILDEKESEEYGTQNNIRKFVVGK